MFRKILSIILIYLLTLPINYIPYIKSGILHAKKYRVTVIDIYTGNKSFSKRMSQFLKDELETKNRIEYFNHNIEIKEEAQPKTQIKKAQRIFDESKFDEIKDIKKELVQQVKDQEYSMVVESYQQIIDIYEENFENLKTIKPLFEAYLKKSYYEGLDEMDDEAKQDMNTAIAIGRNLVFDSSEFAPRFLIKYTRTRNRSKKNAKGSLILNAPSSYELIIDSVSMGNAPVKVTKLSYGKHYILVLDENKQVAKKLIIELNRGKKQKKITIAENKKQIPKEETQNTKPETEEDLLKAINKELSKEEFTESLKYLLTNFAQKINADFIVFGNATKKHDMYNAKIYLFNLETKTVSFLTNGEFDSDLLTGDVEGLRIGNEIVKGIDNFSSLKKVTLKKSNSSKNTNKTPKAKLRIVPFEDYKELDFQKKSQNIVSTEVKTDTKTKIETSKKDNIDLDAIDTVKDDDKEIDIADADYGALKNPELDQYYDEQDKDNKDKWYKKWWVWTAAGVVIIGATAATVYILNQDVEKNSVPQGTW